MAQIVILTGRTCNGKSTLAMLLREEYGFEIFDTSERLQREARKRSRRRDRLTLQKLGDALDKETNFKWVLDGALKLAQRKRKSVVVDNVRNASQLAHFRKRTDFEMVHVHLYAPNDVLAKRFADRTAKRSLRESAKTYRDADLIKQEKDITRFKADADVRIFTKRTDSRDTFVRVAGHLGLFTPPQVRCVDVLVGGQYGSEGKGHVAAYLAEEYDVLVRVGGPNAGHTVSGRDGVYTYHHLPSGCRDVHAEVLLGPGATLYLPMLLKEIDDCRLTSERLYIDPQAMIIDDSDRQAEAALVNGISSTGSGSGHAAARRITGRVPGQTKLACNVPELSRFVGTKPIYRGSTLRRLEHAYREGKHILLEGTQGSGLSLFHGPYPYVTSRDTNVAGCLAEAGISPSRVRRVLMVVRPTPIRVDNSPAGKTSGPLKHETTFAVVAAEAGLRTPDVQKAEKTSTTGRNRRVGWFDWELFRQSCALNAPTDLILTFADYVNAGNQQARRFEQLSQDTIKFIEELERVSQAPVSLINTRFPRTDQERLDMRTVIDRRKWWTGHRVTI